jgi:nucleoid-associated protein EbfC
MDMRALMKQAQKMQEKIQREMAELRVEATVGGGTVAVTMAGNRDLVAVKIAPEVLESKDVEMLEDLVRAAVNEANRKVEEALGEKMGGLGMPGLNMPGL